MPLPPPVDRELHHTRQVTFKGYKRVDGLWDIEGEMSDRKSHEFEIPLERTWQPDEAIHHMRIRLTLDDQLVVKDIAVSMDSIPHAECPKAQDPMKKMIGSSILSGWRKSIDLNLGGVHGCTHLRELLYTMATAAIQTIPASFEVPEGRPPMHLGKCLAWRFDGEAVKMHHPEFITWQEKPKAK